MSRQEIESPVRVHVPGAIDGHSHLFDEDGYVEKHLDQAERLGIARTVVSGLGGEWGLADNAATLAAARRYPDKLVPLRFILLGRDAPEAVVEAKEQGFAGLKFTQPLFAYDDERAMPFYEKAEELGLPALFHCGVLAHVRGIRTSSEFMRPFRLDGVARRFPDLRIQIAHLGVPEYEVATTMARIVPNITVDMTGSPRSGWYLPKTPEFFRSLFYWPSWHRKLVFGTDVRYELLADAVRIYQDRLSALNPTEEMTASVYRDNIREFLGEITREPYRTVGFVGKLEDPPGTETKEKP